MYKKIILAVNCDSEEQQQTVQKIAQDISQTFHIEAKDLINMYPVVSQHKALLHSIIKTVSKEGKKGIIKIVPMLLKSL